MKNWKASLDRYLTLDPPDDGFDDYKGDAQFEDWLLEYDEVCNKWLNKLFNKNISGKMTAKILERGFNLYIKKR